MSFAMEPGHTVGTVYRAVIDEVVSRVKPEFVGEGVDECAALHQSDDAAFSYNALTWLCFPSVLHGARCVRTGRYWMSSACSGKPSLRRAAPWTHCLRLQRALLQPARQLKVSTVVSIINRLQHSPGVKAEHC